MIKLSQRFPASLSWNTADASSALPGDDHLPGDRLLWTLISARIIRVFADVLKLFVFPRTPIEIIMLMMLLLSLYVVRNGLEPWPDAEILFP